MAVARTSPTETAVSFDRRWFTLVTLCVSLMVIGIDNTILNVALPTLVRDLGASASSLQWIVDAYTLVFAGLLLTAGSLGDKFGRRRALTIGLIVFGTASAAAAFSSSTGALIAARAVMGIGGALIMPATLSILSNVFTVPAERARAIGIWAGVSAIGIALGPILGGLLLEHFWWGSVFLVNAPVVVIALILGRFFVPESKDPTGPRLDPLGAVLSIVGLAALLYAIIEVPTRGWSDPAVLGTLAVAIVVLGGFALWELHSDHPMLDVSFFKNPRFTVASWSITMAFFAMSGALFLITQLLQFVMGYDPLAAGYRIAPIAVVLMIVAPQTPKLVERIGTKRTVAIGLVSAATGLLVIASCNPDTSYARVFVGLVVMALGMGLVMAPATESIMGSLPKEKAGVGSAVNDTTRQVGGALGIAVLGSLLAAGYQSQLAANASGRLTGAALTKAKSSIGAALVQAARLTGSDSQHVADAAKAAFTHGMHLALVFGAAVTIVAAILATLYLPARAPHHDLNASELLPGDIVVDDDELAIAGGD
jgi:EmrB/QacA subfamily drug resistance transporter